MKVFQITTLLSLLATTTLATSGFLDTCDGYDLIEGHFLDVECQGSAGKEETYLDLNKCVANLGNQLVAQINGNFYASCKDCGLDDDAGLTCTCGTHTTTINLNDVIANYNGHIDCFGYDGECLNGMFNDGC